MPVVLLHDVQHQQRLLLDGGAELEERGLHILTEENRRRGESVTRSFVFCLIQTASEKYQSITEHFTFGTS